MTLIQHGGKGNTFFDTLFSKYMLLALYCVTSNRQEKKAGGPAPTKQQLETLKTMQ